MPEPEVPVGQDRDFSIISVESDEEDDVVIQAGARPQHGTEPAGVPDAAPCQEQAESATEEAPAASSPSDALLEQAADDEARKEYLDHKARSDARRKAQEMATTEADLHTKAPFAKMQAAIVGVLVVLLAVALVYWFLLR